jgi:hypothetical protein
LGRDQEPLKIRRAYGALHALNVSNPPSAPHRALASKGVAVGREALAA